MSLAFRTMLQEDEAFLYSSWLKSFQLSHFAGVIPMHQYHSVYSNAVKDVLDREGIKVVVAEEQSAGMIVGWCCLESGLNYVTRTREGYKDHGETPVLHYVYIKQPYRKMGVARRLLENAGLDLGAPFIYTFRSSMAATLAKRFRNARFDPLVARHAKNRVHKERE